MIQVFYRAVDGYSKARSFPNLVAARRYAQSRVGETPEIGPGYAIAGDGIGKITVKGCTLQELFPKAFPSEQPKPRRIQYLTNGDIVDLDREDFDYPQDGAADLPDLPF